MKYIVTWDHPSGAGRGARWEGEAPSPAAAAKAARWGLMGHGWGGRLTVTPADTPAEGDPVEYRVEKNRLRRLSPAW